MAPVTIEQCILTTLLRGKWTVVDAVLPDGREYSASGNSKAAAVEQLSDILDLVNAQDVAAAAARAEALATHAAAAEAQAAIVPQGALPERV